MNEKAKIMTWRLIYVVKIEKLLRELGVSITDDNTQLVADLIRDALLDHEPKGRS